jgi:ABC-2 type transport system ATP-binding protein
MTPGFCEPGRQGKEETKTMLSVERVTKKYGKVVANNDISFSVGDGQIAILLGPNGAGKSTIIKCIVGLLRFQGKITVDGHDNKSMEAKRLLGYVPEMPAVYDMLTVEEHLEFIRRAYRLEDDGYSRQLLERFELWDKKDKLGKELSKGMQQKLSICCALAHRPGVVVMDEPLVGLDPHAIKEMKAMLRELKAGGATILISTHMMDSVEDYWDVTHIMMNGSFAATKYSGSEDAGGQSLEELFFAITEGGGEKQ